MVKNDYFISDVNDAQVIENKAQSNFPFNGFFTEGTLVECNKVFSENNREVNFDFSENKVHVNFNVNENINGLVYKRKGEVHCPEFSGE